MPINCYTGLPGSGKSYEVVLMVIIPAVEKGRRVVTNVDGIDGDAIAAYLVEKKGADPDKLGTVVHCSNDDVAKPDFLPHGKDVATLVQPGDMVCIDEAWRFWGTSCKLLEQHKIFFREHRHYVDKTTKVSCDLVMMVQDISDLHRVLRVVVELNFRTTKLKKVGANGSYRVEMWEGYSQKPRQRSAVQVRRYSTDIFPLYSSYVGGVGTEMQVDSRQNVLAKPGLWIGIVLLLLVGGVALWWLTGFFRDAVGGPAPVAVPVAAPVPGRAATSAAGVAVQLPPPDPISTKWRLVGHVSRASNRRIVLADAAGRLRVESAVTCSELGGAPYVCVVDGERVSPWSGVVPGAAGGTASPSPASLVGLDDAGPGGRGRP